MSVTSDILFAYLREIFYATPDATLAIDKLEDDYLMFAKGLMFFAHCFSQYNEFAKALARGDLSVQAPPPENELAAPLKALHASLKHLAWQSQQVAKGDYKQRVDFMGEFSDGFNTMVEQLADRQQKLEYEIIVSQRYASAMEQSNLLLSSLTHYIPQQIFVVSLGEYEVLLFNDAGKNELDIDPEYINKLMVLLPDLHNTDGVQNYDVHMGQGDDIQYLTVNSYNIEWNSVSAVTLIISDVSADKRQIKELEDHAYRDALTRVYNRFFGMHTLSEWVDAKKHFTLIFVDLDSLKYVNDVHGHGEGDTYIISVSKHLQTVSDATLVCRLGGDEFMLLIPDMDFDEVDERMEAVQNRVQNDEHVADKDFGYSISVGRVTVDENNVLPASEMLSLADERMYEHKRARKKERAKALKAGQTG